MADTTPRFRDLACAAGGTGLLLAGVALLLAGHRTTPPHGQQALVEMWQRAVDDFALGPAASLLPVIVGVTVVVAAAVVIALSIRPGGAPPVLRLRRALLLGSAGVVWFFLVRLSIPQPGPAWVAAADIAAYGAGGWALADLAAFLASFPARPEMAVLRRHVRDELGTRLQPSPDDNEARVERLAGLADRQFGFLSGNPFAAAMAAAGVLAGTVFVAGRASPAAGAFALAMSGIGMVAPLFAAGALHVNYAYGTAETRYRIGWIYLGPFAGGLVAMAAFSLSMLWFLAVADRSADYADPAHLALVVSTILAVPVLVAGFVLGLAFAVFHRGGLDPRLAIRRSAVLTFSGLLLTALFVAVEGAVSSQVVMRVGLPDHSGAIVAGTMAALVFAPVRRRVDGFVGRVVERLMPATALVEGDTAMVTVCFVDLCGYTALSSTDQPLAVLHAGLLHKCARNAAEAAGGRLVKTIGDAAMLRLPDPQSAIDGVRRLAEDYGRGAATLDIVPLALHAGIHHGEAIVARDGDLFGATVNLAARLLDAAGEGQVLLSDAAHAAMSVPAPASPVPLMLKSVKGPVSAFVVPLVARA